MNDPVMLQHRLVAPDTHVLPGYTPVPGMGVLAVNAYLIRGPEPVLIDAGLGALREDFLAQLAQLIDLDELRWIWITHTDPDHIGALAALVARAPHARVVTTYLGMGKLGMLTTIAPERLYLLNPGQSLDVGDRALTALRPPTFDAPETTGLLDGRTGALFSSDCFGALLGQARDVATDIPPAELRDGLLRWTAVDSPWLHRVDAPRFEAALDEIHRLQPSTVLSSHLPAAPAMTDTLLAHLRAAREAPPFVGPDQRALSEMLSAA